MSIPSTGLQCLICREPLILRPARGRKSGKLSLMLICPRSGKHFRGFITDQDYVAEVFRRVENQTAAGKPGGGTPIGVNSPNASSTDLNQSGET